MKNYREYLFHAMTVVLVFCLSYYAIPNLVATTNELEFATKTLKSTELKIERNYSRSLPQSHIKTLILTMTDGTEIKSGEDYEEYWPKLQAKQNLGKVVKYYTGINTSKDWNPLQIEIDNKVIYNKNANLKYVILFIAMTFASVIFSIYRLLRYINLKKTVR